MNAHLPTHMDKSTFLAWMQAREGHYELVRGRVVMLLGFSRRHGLIVGNIYLLLRNQLDPGHWQVITEFGLDSEPETLRYPDIVVDAVGGGGKDYTATSPVLVAEVLSPSMAEIDLGDKAAQYLQMTSLRAYLVLGQDEPKAWAWLRGHGGFAPGPQVVEGPDQAIRINDLGLELALSAIYAGLPAN
ncbi:MAG TPA: Uma2 family endonuclease [Pseudolabrys sp.]|jgi:Uma2 family endonuclease|nr:Uma2 family endonuclease [Pseudolabrys sp.]